MSQLADLARILIGCRVVTRDQWEHAASQSGDDLAAVLAILSASPPPWWDGKGDAPTGLTDYQQWVIQSRFTADELAELPRDLALNQFLLLDRLGRGGQGEVYLGRQLNPSRFVAIKTLTRDTEHSRRRFEQEARAMMRVRHPSVAQFHVYERIRDSSGRPTNVYLIAMEFVDGTDLFRLVARSGPVPWKFAAHWAANILDGLAEIHRHGFVHRDVKPENIIVVGPQSGPTSRPEQTTAKLLDFGAVRPSEGEGSTARTFVGTREYAPPEQWTGEAVPASDIYSLGGSLYYLLTGRHPYMREGRDPMALMAAHRDEPAPDISAKNPNIPPELDQLYRRMMAKDPADRGTATELADAFLAILGRSRAPAPAAPAKAAPPKTTPARPAELAAPTDDDRSWIYRRVFDPTLAILERLFIPGHLRPRPGAEVGPGERLASLLRRPAFLGFLVLLIAVAILLIIL